MIVDTSAVIAILRGEPDAARYAASLATGPALMSAATYVECGIVIDSRRDPVTSQRLDDLLREARIEVVAVTAELAALARRAHRDFGRGSGHPARLSFGDCFSYALAVATGEPLLFKGDDFRLTDVEAAI